MFTADDAKNAVQNAQKNEIEPILNIIKKIAEEGKSSTNYYDKPLSQNVITTLKDLGFKVSVYSSSYRDEGNQLVVISW